MCGATLPLRQYTLMAWFSVKRKYRDNFTFTSVTLGQMRCLKIGHDYLLILPNSSFTTILSLDGMQSMKF